MNRPSHGVVEMLEIIKEQKTKIGELEARIEDLINQANELIRLLQESKWHRATGADILEECNRIVQRQQEIKNATR